MSQKPIVLAILDGWGYSRKNIGNAIAAAKTPTMDMLTRQYPMLLLQASGSAVGMTWGESGNSETGHLNIGAGRIVEQYLTRINRSVQDGSFFENHALTGAFDHAQQNNSRVHLIGLLTSGTAHSDFSHIPALLEFARQKGWPETYIHLFLDGKDSGLRESPELLKKLDLEIQTKGYGKIATLIGRNFAMDRDNNWELTQKTYELLTKAAGKEAGDYLSTLNDLHNQGRTDSNMVSIVVKDSGFTGINENDALIFFNFREDSMRQILKAFIEQKFTQFPRKELRNIYVSTMTKYLEPSAGDLMVQTVFDPPEIINGLAETLENNGKKQLHVAETEKYAHATYFFNGLKSSKFSGETDAIIESFKDNQWKPAMRSPEITQKVTEGLNEDNDFIVLNFANADILAHTGNLDATIKGIEAIDNSLGLIYNYVVSQNDGILVVTADHGNAEALVYRGSGEEETKHNENPVPFYLIGRKFQTEKTAEKIKQETREVSGILADIAPTILELMGIPQPEEMTGKSLLPMLVSIQ